MTNQHQPRPRRQLRAAGFTLVELLVVIGIIIVLLGILIPVVSKMRTTGYVTASKSQLSKIQYAVQSYYNEFQGYPGAMAHRDMVKSALSSKVATVDGGAENLTSTEDLYLSLCGGWTAAGGKLTFKSENLGTGPVTFSTVAAASKQYKPFFEHREGDSTPQIRDAGVPKYVPIKSVTDMEAAYVLDTAIPEFVDQFPVPRPVLYLRANPAARPSGNVADVVTNSGQTFNANAAYNIGTVVGYFNESTDFGGLKRSDAPNETVQNLFTSSTTGSGVATKSARFAGTFILIAAGADRIFGTGDDLIVGGGGG